jgi:hypothetical protein
MIHQPKDNDLFTFMSDREAAGAVGFARGEWQNARRENQDVPGKVAYPRNRSAEADKKRWEGVLQNAKKMGRNENVKWEKP